MLLLALSLPNGKPVRQDTPLSSAIRVSQWREVSPTYVSLHFDARVNPSKTISPQKLFP